MTDTDAAFLRDLASNSIPEIAQRLLAIAVTLERYENSNASGRRNTQASKSFRKNTSFRVK
jgi:hypothetical protein